MSGNTIPGSTFEATRSRVDVLTSAQYFVSVLLGGRPDLFNHVVLASTDDRDKKIVEANVFFQNTLYPGLRLLGSNLLAMQALGLEFHHANIQKIYFDSFNWGTAEDASSDVAEHEWFEGFLGDMEERASRV
jgi:hypothetical protein